METTASSYISGYQQQLDKFILENPDASHEEFIEKELQDQEWVIFYFDHKEDIIAGDMEGIVPTSSEYYSAQRIFEFLTKKKSEIIKKGPSKRPAKEVTLEDIWQVDEKGTKDSYHRSIQELKSRNNTIDAPFVEERDGKLYWSQTHGSISYLAGFIHTCLLKGWIRDQHTSIKLTAILGRTFNIQFNPKPFKSLRSNPPDEKYLIPFRKLAAGR